MARQRQRSRGQGTLFKRNGASPWIASWYDHAGKRKEQSTRTTDKATAEAILRKLVGDVALRRFGVVDPRADRYVDAEARQLVDHLSDWIAALKGKGVTPQPIGEARSKVLKLLAATKA